MLRTPFSPRRYCAKLPYGPAACSCSDGIVSGDGWPPRSRSQDAEEEAAEGKSSRSRLIGPPLRHGVMFATPLMPCRSSFDRNLSKPEIVESVLAEIFHALCVLMV